MTSHLISILQFLRKKGGLSLLLIFIGFTSQVSAATTFRLSTSLPSEIFAGNPVKLSIKALDHTGTLISDDTHDLSIFIFNNDVSQTKSITLIDGHGEIELTFEKPGASLIQTFDPANKNLIDYLPLNVLNKLEKK